MRTITKPTMILLAAALIIGAMSICACAQDLLPEWEISVQDFKQAVETIKKDEPDYYAALLLIKKDDEEYYTELVADWIFEQRDLEDMKQHDPEYYNESKKQADLEKEERRLTGLYRTAKTEVEKQSINKKLMVLLDQLFDEKLRLQKLDVRELESELSSIKRDIERREKNKQKIIERRLAELKGEDEDLEW